MQWINGVGKLKVTHRVKVPFAVDGYTDKVECDVLPLHVCHLLLGRPWQHDVNALHHGRTNRYTFMHKGKFYTLLPKDGKDIKCTVEVFKRKSASSRSKPRTVSIQGREDDAVLSTAIINSLKVARYVVPARRRDKELQTVIDIEASESSKNLSQVMVGLNPVAITSADEIEPRFRTPCRFLMVGKIAIKI
jgi:hypothetical protein